jgi:hypothetical protein
MIDLNAAKINQLVIHHIGNRLEEENIRFSSSPLKLPDNHVTELLLRFFTSHFKSSEYYNFAHTADISLNDVFTYVSQIFTKKDQFFVQSLNLAKHLYEQSNHPKVKAGEFYVVYFNDCIVEGEMVDAIGLFKSESKETYLKVISGLENFEINYEDGININKLDKGAIIFNYEKDKGYLVSIVDNLSKTTEAQYWKDDFLHLKNREDEFHFTKNILNLTKDFVVNKMPEEFEVNKADQAEILTRSLKFFKEKGKFSLEEFSDEVMEQPDIIDSFKDYRKQYQTERQISISDDFDISEQAVKKQTRIFKSVIKLDKNFHIYVHGNRTMIERGVDEATGMKYYKLYFKEEN